MCATEPLCVIDGLGHHYDDRQALTDLNIQVASGEVVSVLGPNGSGKTTLFRLLCTLMPVQSGTIRIAGVDASVNPLSVRAQIGIVFQSPSLDKKLTVDENIACQAALYGISGKALNIRRDEMLERLRLTDRRHDLCEKLSGGLKRRVELAKGMLHRPKLLLLDEPSTGLDPAARLDLWSAVREMADDGMAIMMTTHLIEEADKSDRVIIMAAGRKIADAPPGQLRSEMGESIISIESSVPVELAAEIERQFNLKAQVSANQVHLVSPHLSELMPQLIELLGEKADSISVGKPSLEDVFVQKTGTRFDVAEEVAA